MVFPVVLYGCEIWTIKKVDHKRIDAFELNCWRRLLRIPWSTRSNQSILKEISPEYSLEGLMLRLKLQYFGYLMRRAKLIRKDLDAGKVWRQKEKGIRVDEMAGWHHCLDGHEFEQAPVDGEGQESLSCLSPWGSKELDMTEWLNNNHTWLHSLVPVYLQSHPSTCIKIIHVVYLTLHGVSSLQSFCHQEPVSWKTSLPQTEGGGLGMIQAHYVYCALYFNYYYIVIHNKIIIQLSLATHW